MHAGLRGGAAVQDRRTRGRGRGADQSAERGRSRRAALHPGVREHRSGRLRRAPGAPAAETAPERGRAVVRVLGAAREARPRRRGVPDRLPCPVRARRRCTPATPTSTCASSPSRAPRSWPVARCAGHRASSTATTGTPAFAPLFLRTLYRAEPLLAPARTLLTIHNIGYQGIFPAARVADLGLEPEQLPLLYQPDLAGRPDQRAAPRHPLRGCDQHRQPHARARDLLGRIRHGARGQPARPRART